MLGKMTRASDRECTAVEEVPVRAHIPLRRYHSKRHRQVGKRLKKREIMSWWDIATQECNGTYTAKSSIIAKQFTAQHLEVIRLKTIQPQP